MRERRVEKVGAGAAATYLTKAEEFVGASEAELSDQRWNAAGLAAIHAGIWAADSVLAAVAGVRSRETDHAAVIALLDERVAAFTGANRRQLVGLLRSKNAVEYEDRLLSEVEAIQLVDHARRLCRWAGTIVAPPET